MNTYKITVTREEDNWLATVDALDGVQTWAKSLTALERDVREAIALALDLPEGGESDLQLEVEYDVTDGAVNAAAALGNLRKLIEEQEFAAARRVPSVVRSLIAAGYSVRDVSVLLAMSPGRVSQITSAEESHPSAERRDDDVEELEFVPDPEKELLASTFGLLRTRLDGLRIARDRQHAELSRELMSTAESLSVALAPQAASRVWGERELKAIAKAAGVLSHVESIARERDRSDFLIALPGGKTIAVEAKRYLGHSRDIAGESTVSQCRAHVARISSHNYWSELDARPEMVLAFLPSESELAGVLEIDPSFPEFAFSKKVALVTPISLFSVFKAIAVAWQQEAVGREAEQVLDSSRELYSELSSLALHMDGLYRPRTVWRRRRFTTAG